MSLSALGLTQYERETYLALLKVGKGKVSDIVKEAKIPRPSAYEALDSLFNFGLVDKVLDRPLTYSSKDPKTALVDFARRKADKLVEAASKTADNLVFTSAKVEHPARLISGSPQAYQSASRITIATSKELLIISQGKDQTLRKARHDWSRLIEKKVVVRLIVPQDSPLVADLISKGIRVRVWPSSGMSLLVSDRKVAQVSVITGENRATMRVESEAYAKAHGDYFDKVWDLAFRDL